MLTYASVMMTKTKIPTEPKLDLRKLSIYVATCLICHE